MTNADLEDRLKLIAKLAPELRKAGVVGKVAIGDVAFELDPLDPGLIEAPSEPTTTPDKPDDAMRDPDLYGGEVPRRRGTPPPPDKDRDPWPSPTSGGKPPRAKRTS